MTQKTAIIPGGMNVLRWPVFPKIRVIRSFGHKDDPKQGAMTCRQGEESWKLWKAGAYGDVSLSDGVVQNSNTREEVQGAFLTFRKDADQVFQTCGASSGVAPRMLDWWPASCIKPKLGLRPKPFGEACDAFWMLGDLINNGEPQGNQIF